MAPAVGEEASVAACSSSCGERVGVGEGVGVGVGVGVDVGSGVLVGSGVQVGGICVAVGVLGMTVAGSRHAARHRAVRNKPVRTITTLIFDIHHLGGLN